MECNYWKIVEAFEKMRDAQWNINWDLKWWFFFFSKSPEALWKFSDKIKEDWYIIENLWETDDLEDWVLSISKIELHTPKTLHERNVYLNNLADLLNIEYDGWDVEPLK